MDFKGQQDRISIEPTADGSVTLYSTNFEAHYHSTHGALQESIHVFIQEGCKWYADLYAPSSLSILEFGLGTALNAILTWRFAEQQDILIDYRSLEGYPVTSDIYTRLDYGDSVSSEDLLRLHQLSWDVRHSVSDRFTFLKQEVMFEDFSPEQGNMDLVYYDAFAPSCQEHLWEIPILTKAYEALKPGGVLVTFCAKGSFKRALKSLGMKVERVPGPPGKREMTRATK